MATAESLAPDSTLNELRERMKRKLDGIIPEFEITLKSEYAHQINQLKRERNAVILGHNYMEPALYHSVPDHTGDSLQLSILSTKTKADIIVFCGVWFMGETAKVLNPGKTVLVPSKEAGCSLAAGITAADVRALRERFPGAPVVTYVNTYAEVKAESDYCCTSGNADKVLKHLFEEGHRVVLFLPDEYLARNTAAELGAKFVLAKEADAGSLPQDSPVVVGWHVRCEVHELFTVEDVENLRRQYPDAAILAHPECSPEVVARVDYTGSTKGMIDYVQAVAAPRYALLTECSMGDNIAAEFPDREMVRGCSLRCKHMNFITLEQALAALQNMQFTVDLAPEIIQRARQPIDRMISIR